MEKERKGLEREEREVKFGRGRREREREDGGAGMRWDGIIGLVI